MYKNRISRPSPNRRLQYFIPRSEIAFDERLPFIEHVLETLLESRFGPGSVYQSVVRSSDRPEPGSVVFYDPCDSPELEPVSFLDLCDAELNGSDWPPPCCARSTLGRTKYFLTQRTQSTQRINSSVLFVPSVVKISLGRGSPVTN